MTETYCTLCQAPFSSAQAAKEHFAGKRHLKNLEKLRMMPPSTEAWSASTRGVFQPKTTQSQQQSETRQNSSYCDLCNAPFSSIEAARQHYAGKRHIKMVVKQQIFPAIASNVAGMMRKTTTQSAQLGDSIQEKQRPTTSGRDTMVVPGATLLSANDTSSSKPNTKADPQYKRLNTRDLIQEKQRPTTSGRDTMVVPGASSLSANDSSSSKPNAKTDHLTHAEKTDQPTNDQQSPSAHGVSTHAVGVRHGARSPWVRTVDSSSSVLSQSFSEEDAYFCKTCSMPLSGPVPAKQHYSGRTHRKRTQTASCSSQLVGILEKGGQSNSRPDLDFESSRREVEKTTFCGVCNVPLSGPQPAMQHYSGRAHKRKLELLRKGELPMIPLPWQRHPTGVASSKEEDSGVSMSDGLQEETNKRREESKETTLKSSNTTEEKCSPFSKSSDIGMDQSERRSVSGGQMDQSERRSASKGQMDQSERRSSSVGQTDQSVRRPASGAPLDQSKQRSASISGGHIDQSEWRSASQDQSSSSTLTSSSWSTPLKFGQTRAPSEVPFARLDCRLYSRSVSAPTAGHKSHPHRMLPTSRLACNFQTQMAPPNTGERTAQPGTLRAGFPPKSFSSTVCDGKGTQSVAVLPFVSRQFSVPVVMEDKPCEKTFLKTSPTLSNTEDLDTFKTLCPVTTSDMLPRAVINLKDDTTIDNQQRPKKGNEIVSGTEADDFRSSVGQSADASTSEQIAKSCQEMKDARGKIEDFLRNRPDQCAPKEPPSTSPSERSSTITTERETPPTHGPAQAITNTTSPEEPLFFCDICKLSMSGPRPLFDHYNGAKHKKKLKILALLNPENTTGTSNSSEVHSNGPLAMVCGNLPTTLGDNMNSTANKTHNKDLDIKYTSTSMFSSTAFMKKISEQIARTPQEKEELLSDVTVIPCSQPVHFK
ncbi:uncharacterized protein LOC144908509 isoform X1 [Branchiostoma floridae x Branchiostoma belcheri]